MPKRPLLTEAAVRDAARRGESRLAVAPNALVTALARDTARDLGIELAVGAPSGVPASGTQAAAAKPAASAPPPKTLAFGCDHAGFAYKSDLVKLAGDLGWRVLDVGTDSTERADYPDFAYAVGRLVARGEAVFGVMTDGVGVGSAMVLNKMPGIRAAVGYTAFAAFNGRAHNDANVLCLGSRAMGVEECKAALRTFLETPFEGGRHAERVQKIVDVEARFLPRADAL